MNKKIGIIGLGFVGDALKNGFEHFGVSNISVHEPRLKTNIKDIEHCDVVFVCVPTPMGKGGTIDDNIVGSVLDELSSMEFRGVVVIKSTLLPTSVNKFIKDYDLRIMTNPEYLTERRAREDFINTQWVILGGEISEVVEVKEIYERIYSNSDVKYAHVTAEAAMMAKYMTNTWFSVKVALMNEFHELWNSLCDNDKASGKWDDLVKAFSYDDRVGPTHLDVPGPDGDFGFGGKCLAGDEIAYVKFGGFIDIYNFNDLYLMDKNRSSETIIEIASYNHTKRKIEFKPIEGIKQRIVDQSIKIKTDKGLRLTSSIDHNHLVYDCGTNDFKKVKACDLVVGQYLASINVPIDYKQDNRQNTISLCNYNKVKWFKVNRQITDQEIDELYSENLISKDQKLRLLNGDRTILPKACLKLNNINMSTILKIKTNSSSEFDANITIDNDYAKIIGYYLAEGNITIDNKRKSPITYFSFGFHEDEYIKDLCDSLKAKGFKYHSRIDKYNGHDSVNVIVVKNSILGYLLTDILKCGSNSKIKKIPHIIFNNMPLIKDCLSAYFRGDGTVKNGHGKYLGFNFASQSKILIEQTNNILLNIGVFASYTQKRGKKSTGISHQLNINRKEDIIKLVEFLNLTKHENNFVENKLPHIQDNGSGYVNYIQNDDYTLVRIVDIKLSDDPIEVFSTQVEDNGNFITSGNLLTANCFPKDLNALMSLASNMQTSTRVMSAAWNDNSQYRQNKDWLTIDGAVSDDYIE